MIIKLYHQYRYMEIVQLPNQQVSINEQEMSDESLFDELLNKSTAEELDKLIDEINQEKELRKLKEKRLLQLKKEIRLEKAKMLNEVKEIKIRMLKNLQEENIDEDEEEEAESEPEEQKPKRTRKQQTKKGKN